MRLPANAEGETGALVNVLPRALAQKFKNKRYFYRIPFETL
jgi:hypothetical protein